jgi:hypothetical protein
MPNATAAEKEEWLTALLKSTDNNTDTEAFLIVLRALAESDLPDAALRAERWLVRLERSIVHDEQSQQRSLRQEQSQLPNIECYQRVVEAWAAATKEHPSIAVTRAERWLMKHIDNSNKSMRPNTACFNAFLDLCSKGRALKAGANGRHLVTQHAEKAKLILELMIDDRKKRGGDSIMAPDTDSFNFVIRAYTRIRFKDSVAETAMEILQQLEDYQSTVDENVKPNIKSYAMVMDAIAVRARQVVQQSLRRKDLWNDPVHNGLNQVKLLKNIVDYMKSKGGASLQPNTHAYNVICSAWANLSSPMHPDAPHQAEKVVQHMMRLRDEGHISASPDAYSYQMVMRAWKNSNTSNRGKRVSWWLDKQWKDFEFEGNEALQPNTATYNLVIQVWASMKEPLQAEKVLLELTRLGVEGHKHLMPNSESYAAVIKAWLLVADRGSRSAIDSALDWLKTVALLEQDNPPQATTSVDWYSGIISAARKCAPQYPDVLEVAMTTFDQLKQSHHVVDCLHYSRLLQTALLALSREEDNAQRSELVRDIVAECCEQGLVSRPLIRALANGQIYYDGWTIEESMRSLDDLFPEWPLPSSWTRNVRQRGLFPQRSDFTRRNFEIAQHGTQFLDVSR